MLSDSLLQGSVTIMKYKISTPKVRKRCSFSTVAIYIIGWVEKFFKWQLLYNSGCLEIVLPIFALTV